VTARRQLVWEGEIPMKTALASLFLLLSAIATPFAVAAQPLQAAVRVNAPVFIIRHFQKATGADPSLTVEGGANAQRLAAILKDKGIKAVFATQTRRAMETGEPLAKALGLTVTPYDPSNVAALAAAVTSAAGPVLIVGHSNTVPELVALFGGARPAPIGDEEYGKLFEVAPNGTVTTAAVR
jgi:phosphohistidine phosphatase SixA